MSTTHPCTPRQAGFSLVEVMVAVLVISIGLLGVAKMQALALSTTGSARLRALASLEAASLASTIRIDRGYWAVKPTVGNNLTVSIVGSAVQSTGTSDSALTSPPTNCNYGGNTPACPTAVGMAAWDLKQWASDFNNVMSNGNASAGGTATITCQLPAPVSGGLPTNPVTCRIQLNWLENLVNANSSQATSQTGQANLTNAQYTIVVQP